MCVCVAENGVYQIKVPLTLKKMENKRMLRYSTLVSDKAILIFSIDTLDL